LLFSFVFSWKNVPVEFRGKYVMIVRGQRRVRDERHGKGMERAWEE
jgi:hypothetical protein